MEPGRTYIDVVIDGEDRTFDLTDVATLSIGRSPQATVVLTDDTNVSRKHALVQRESSGEYYLSDLGSRNGTTRNGLPVTAPVPLQDGDSFTIGSHRFVFHQTVDRSAEEEAYQPPTDVLVVERMISILVLDIRNYTGLARELGEARISELMNKLFHESGQLLKRNGSWTQKYIGDAVMAFWVHGDGQSTPKEILAIFDSVSRLARLIAGLQTEFALARPLAFGAGINSGLAVTGNMGSAGLSDHTAMGDAVNKAFRLESATKEVGREILVGQGTYALLKAHEPARALFSTHTVHLKGYDVPEQAHGLGLADLPRLLAALGA
ncbi:MAG: adenylate/guanylate cyclase domain-containing protein [Longimicrobiales bacterium]